MITTTVEITPDIAREMLESNTSNRPLNALHVKELAQEMTLGRWVSNGDTIVFDVKGALMDGQHRLEAIIRSGTKQQVLVVYGVGSDAFLTKDRGRLRRPSDMFAIAGEKNYVQLSHAVAKCIQIETEWLTKKPFRYNPNPAISYDWLNRNRDIVNFMEGYNHRIVTVACRVAISYLYSKKGYDLSSFFESVQTGAGLNIDNPALVLRNKMQEYKRKGTAVGIRFEIISTILAANAWLKNKPLKRINCVTEIAYPLPI